MDEKTLFLIKPDGVARGLIGVILQRVESKGLRCEKIELRNCTRDLAWAHYAEHVERDFFSSLINFFTSGPLLACVVAGERAIEAARQLAGGTDPVGKALPGTIRGDFGLSGQQNLVHSSDSPESAEREIGLWFPEL